MCFSDYKEGYKEYLKQALDKWKIKTVRDLVVKVVTMEDKQDFMSQSGVMPSAFSALLDRVNISPEDYLDKRILPLQLNEVNLKKQFYVEKADTFDTSFKYQYEDAGTVDRRTDDIILALGESGSGKTLFTLGKGAFSETVGIPFDKEAKHVVVYYDSTFCSDSMDAPLLLRHVKQILHEGSGGRYDKDSEMKLNMRLTLVVDEAGAVPVFFGSIKNYKDVYTRLKGLVNEPHSCRLIVAGTGLDAVTSAISSKSDLFKYRMTPWNDSEMKAAWAQFIKLPDTAVALAASQPILASLCTNRRAARFVAKALNEMSNVEGTPPIFQGKVKDIALSVCRQYILENGLKDMTEEARAWVAAAVICELHRSEWEEGAEQPDVGRFVPMKTKSRQQIIRRAQGLLNVHVEQTTVDSSGDRECSYLSKAIRSSTVSPAIALLLYLLLGPQEQFGESFKSYETVCALYAIKRKVLNLDMDTVQSIPTYAIARLKERIPEPNAQKSFKFPDVPHTTVCINGAMAPFGDAFSHYELHQSKLCETSSRRVALVDLEDELKKKGALKTFKSHISCETDSKDIRGEVAIACMYAVWNGTLPTLMQQSTGGSYIPDENENKVMARYEACTIKSSHHFPEVLLHVPEAADAVPLVHFSLKEDQENNETYIVHEPSQTRIPFQLETFPEATPLDIFFHTNINEFVLKLPGQEPVSVSVACQDVDKDGILISPNAAYTSFIENRVKQNVRLHFCFGSSVNG